MATKLLICGFFSSFKISFSVSILFFFQWKYFVLQLYTNIYNKNNLFHKHLLIIKQLPVVKMTSRKSDGEKTLVVNRVVSLRTKQELFKVTTRWTSCVKRALYNPAFYVKTIINTTTRLLQELCYCRRSLIEICFE